MKIALVSDWYYPKTGGVATHIRDLALHLRSRGHEVMIVTNNHGVHDDKELDEKGVSIYRVSGLTVPLLSTNISPYASRELRNLLSRENPDIFHAHHAFTPLSLRGMAMAKEENFPTVLTTHSIFLAYDSPVWDIFNQAFPVLGWFIDRADRIIAVSNAAKAFISHFTQKQVAVIPNGVDSKKFHPNWNKERLREDLGIEEERIILCVSRLSYRKGIHVLLNAMKILTDEMDDIRLIILGEGEMFLLLRTQAKSLDLENRVSFMGYVPSQQLPKFYGMTDVFVLPSITAEAFGIVLLEAMASGKPVVATNVGGIPEVVESSNCGILVDPWDEYALAEAIFSLLEDESLRNELGRNGRKAVENRYSWDIIAEKIERVYQEIV